jgi:hypothetical protein
MRGGSQIWSIDVDGAHLRPLTTQGKNKLPDWGS